MDKIVLDNRIVIRLFEAADLQVVYQLTHRTIDICYSEIYPPKVNEFFRGYHSKDSIQKRAKDGYILVMELSGRIIATGSLVGNEISGVFVDTDYQASGYGRLMMNQLETLARGAGHKEVTLCVSFPSRKFYETLGYDIYEDACLCVGDGQKLDYWNARKVLV